MSLNDPGAHWAQGAYRELFRWNWPGAQDGQAEAEHDEEPTTAHVPLPQAVQDVAPVAPLYVFLGQRGHDRVPAVVL